MQETSNQTIPPHATYGELRRLCAASHIDVTSAILPKTINGIYNHNLHIIVIDRRMTYTQKRCTLVHELIHHLYGDDACDPILHARIEHRTRRETANTLIPTTEYATLEHEYDGDRYHIATELDVTIQVINDYQNMILDPTIHVQQAL